MLQQTHERTTKGLILEDNIFKMIDHLDPNHTVVRPATTSEDKYFATDMWVLDVPVQLGIVGKPLDAQAKAKHTFNSMQSAAYRVCVFIHPNTVNKTERIKEAIIQVAKARRANVTGDKIIWIR